MSHGSSEELFYQELAKAKANSDIVRMEVLHAAYDIADHIDYEHMHTVVDLKQLQKLVEQKIRFVSTRF